jgi:hypothetical protein
VKPSVPDKALKYKFPVVARRTFAMRGGVKWRDDEFGEPHIRVV